MIITKSTLLQLNRRQVRTLAINSLALAGIVIAVSAVVFSQDQGIVLSQMSNVFTNSPLGAVISIIKSLF